MRQHLILNFLFIYFCLILAQTTSAEMDSSSQHPINQKSTQKLSLTINALYFRPDNIGTEVDQTKGFLLFDFSPEYRWGVGLLGRYHLDKNRRTSLEWLHYRNEVTQSNLRVNNLKGEGAVNVPYGYHSDFDILYFEIERVLDLKEYVTLQLNAGVEYAYMNVGYNFNFVSNTTQSSQTFSTDYLYHSVGPMIGLDLNFMFPSSFDLSFKSIVSILSKFGDYDLDARQINRSGGAVINNRHEKMHNPLNGALLQTDLQCLMQYQHPTKTGNMTIFGGIRGLIFLEDLLNWGGAVVGIKWTDTI